jgi:HAD superfamily hydrolase (TIGR01509 family)
VIEAILFDMDGVLADSEPMWNEIDGAMLAECGIEYHGEHKQSVLGKSFPIALQFYKETYNLPQSIEQLSERRTAIAIDFYGSKIDTFADVTGVLAALRARELPLGVATSSVGALIYPFLQRHGITDYFTTIVTGEEVTRGKPFPDIYLKCAQKVGVAPEKCLVVEDALAGIQAGKSAGMTVAAIPDPRFSDVSLFPEKADYILNRLGELTDLVDTLRKE